MTPPFPHVCTYDRSNLIWCWCWSRIYGKFIHFKNRKRKRTRIKLEINFAGAVRLRSILISICFRFENVESWDDVIRCFSWIIKIARCERTKPICSENMTNIADRRPHDNCSAHEMFVYMYDFNACRHQILSLSEEFCVRIRMKIRNNKRRAATTTKSNERNEYSDNENADDDDDKDSSCTIDDSNASLSS